MTFPVLTTSLELLRRVAAGVPASRLDAPTPCSEWTVAQVLLHAAGACALDAAIHAWDIAAATGQGSPLTAELATQLQPAASVTVGPLRGFAYAPALPGQPGEDAAAALLRYLGRDPGWTT